MLRRVLVGLGGWGGIGGEATGTGTGVAGVPGRHRRAVVRCHEYLATVYAKAGGGLRSRYEAATRLKQRYAN